MLLLSICHISEMAEIEDRYSTTRTIKERGYSSLVYEEKHSFTRNIGSRHGHRLAVSRALLLQRTGNSAEGYHCLL